MRIAIHLQETLPQRLDQTHPKMTRKRRSLASACALACTLWRPRHKDLRCPAPKPRRFGFQFPIRARAPFFSRERASKPIGLGLPWRGSKGQGLAEKRLHELRHGQEKVALKRIATLKEPHVEAMEVIRKEESYFANQRGRMNYKEISDHGWPIGSGAVESACRQSQCRFKRCGQFWSDRDFRHLSALDEPPVMAIGTRYGSAHSWWLY
jgi:hypothetical protein